MQPAAATHNRRQLNTEQEYNTQLEQTDRQTEHAGRTAARPYGLAHRTAPHRTAPRSCAPGDMQELVGWVGSALDLVWVGLGPMLSVAWRGVGWGGVG